MSELNRLAYTRIRGGKRGIELPDMPLGVPDGILLIVGETAEERAFRRFPITSHKPEREIDR